MSRRNILLASTIGGGEGKVVNHITYTVSDKPMLFGMYKFHFYSEYPVKSYIYIGLSNGNELSIHNEESESFTYGPLDLGILGISFITKGSYMSEIEDDLYIYKIEL
jgi:hypothetical protein